MAQNIIETQIESRLRFADVPDLAALQAEADRWRRHFNARARHSRLRTTRNAAWLRITPEQLRTASRETLMAISRWKLVERTVSDRMTIGVDTRLRGLPPQEYDLRNLALCGLRPRDRVRVELNPFTAPDVIVIKMMPDGEERRWNVSPMQKDEWGFDASAPVMGESYRAMPETDADRALKDIRTTAKGTQGSATATGRAEATQKPRPYANLNIMADVSEAPLYLRPDGTTLLSDAGRTAAPMPLTHAQASMRLRALTPDAFGRDAVACMDYVRARFPEYVPEDKLDGVAAELTRRFGPVRPATVLSFSNEPVRRAAQGGAS